jgi:hypothetical protein
VVRLYQVTEIPAGMADKGLTLHLKFESFPYPVVWKENVATESKKFEEPTEDEVEQLKNICDLGLLSIFLPQTFFSSFHFFIPLYLPSMVLLSPPSSSFCLSHLSFWWYGFNRGLEYLKLFKFCLFVCFGFFFF